MNRFQNFHDAHINSSSIHPIESIITNTIHLIRSEDIDALVECVHLAVQLAHELLVNPDLFLPASGFAVEIVIGEFEISGGNLQTTSLLSNLTNALLKRDLVILNSLGGLLESLLVNSHQGFKCPDIIVILLLELDTSLKNIVKELLKEFENLLGGGTRSKVLCDLNEHTGHRC